MRIQEIQVKNKLGWPSKREIKIQQQAKKKAEEILFLNRTKINC